VFQVLDTQVPSMRFADPVMSEAVRVALGVARRGFRGRIAAIEVPHSNKGLSPAELERRLIELGFIEGAEVEILHEGLIGHDPIAVRVDGATVAIRRREAMAILVS
jgi:ferrous iron transport protein A